MMRSRQIVSRALLVGGVLVMCSLAIYNLVPNSIAPYVMLPGVFVGVFVAAILAAIIKGNAHGADWITIWVVASVINFLCYVAVTYLVLLLWSKRFKNMNREKGAGPPSCDPD